MKDWQLNQYRNKIAEKAVWGTTYSRSRVGIFSIPLNANETARAIADNGQNHPEWEHVSVSLPTRCLTWEEMCKIKYMFFDESETVIQIHPAKENYVNLHPFCLHLWKPKTQKLPLPPPELVL